MVRLALFGGLGFVFLYFGIDKIVHPLFWQGWMPPSMDGFLGYPISTWLTLIAAAEIGIGIGCIVPQIFIQRMAAFFAAAHLIGVLTQTGWNDIAVRDVGLLCMAVAAWYSTSP